MPSLVYYNPKTCVHNLQRFFNYKISIKTLHSYYEEIQIDKTEVVKRIPGAIHLIAIFLAK